MRSLILSLLASLPALALDPLGPPPPEVRKDFNLADHYQKCLLAEGFPIVGSAKAQDMSLREAGWLIDQMLAGREDVRRALIGARVRYSVMAHDEFTTSVPEHADLKPAFYWDKRARGLGASPSRPSVSCGEENLLCLHGDPYSTENILVHEFAHAIDIMGLRNVHPDWEKRLRDTYEASLASGKWKNKYASTNKEEFFAEGVQSWFDTNRENDHDHNHVNTREELLEYDPALAALCREVFGDRPWRYTRPETRLELPHLAGYNRDILPRFAWPQALSETYKTCMDPDAPSIAGQAWAPVDLRAPTPGDVSAKGGAASTLILVNARKEAVKVAWVDFEGRTRHEQILRPRLFVMLDTYAGHLWAVRDEAGTELGAFVAEGAICRGLVK